ncbi:hypothetical protein [Roseivivax sp. THAF30]|uniref:hypothetical protein n=1 Tax=Roseivivax sp. THAF30 TaxID=2587852 RepID=UPI0012685743|nr:hypothetical protein [Roseivivax sp. THAF30]QFT61564.1 hypothetical protein FIU91_01380 [Roseivivax sp. THAF30]
MTPAQKRALGTILATDDRNTAEASMIKLLQNKLPKLLETADVEFLRLFFTHLEVHAPASLAKKIAVHELRPEEVTKLVEARKAEIDAQKASKPSCNPKDSGEAD